MILEKKMWRVREDPIIVRNWYSCS